jgi:hypothetical protein
MIEKFRIRLASADKRELICCLSEINSNGDLIILWIANGFAVTASNCEVDDEDVPVKERRGTTNRGENRFKTFNMLRKGFVCLSSDRQST